MAGGALALFSLNDRYSCNDDDHDDDDDDNNNNKTGSLGIVMFLVYHQKRCSNIVLYVQNEAQF